MSCSEKYGNDLPTAVRSDVGRNEEPMATDIAIAQNPSITQPNMNSIPVTMPMTEYVDSSNSPLPPKLDPQGSFTLPSIPTTGGGTGGGMPSQNSILRGVCIHLNAYVFQFIGRCKAMRCIHRTIRTF